MPSRGSYEINGENGKIVREDESYRSCILAMLIFLFLSIILILASLPWKKFQSRYNEDVEYSSARIKGEKHTTEKIEETTEMKNEKTINNNNNEEEKSLENSTSRLMEETDGTSEESQEIISTTVEKFSNTETTTRKIESKSKPNDEKSTTENLPTSIVPFEEINEKSTTVGDWKTLMEQMVISTRESRTTENSILDYTSLRKLLVGKYFGNESTTLRNEDSQEDWFNSMESGTKKEIKNQWEKSTKNFQTLPVTMSTNSLSDFFKTTKVMESKESASSTTNSFVETTGKNFQEIRRMNICQTGSCKQLASKILSYMNHSVDPCDDFYEYACGGLEADPQINEKVLLRNVYEKIEMQARKKKNSGDNTFLEYYESCLKYESDFNINHRVVLAKDSLEKVGKFYTMNNWPGDFQGFTALFSNMLLHNRPLLFDIVPDVNEKNPETFTLKIGPAIDSNPFRSSDIKSRCKEDDTETLKDHVNLDHLYENYKNCRKDTSFIVISISQALKDLGIFEELQNPFNITFYLEDTVTNIYHEIIEGILTYYPPNSEIREAYRSKHYTVTTISELETTCKLLNWTELIKSLTGLTLDANTELQIYFKDELTRALQHLEEFSRKRELGLNNALLGLYARNLYQDLVVARPTMNLEKKCFDIAAGFMKTEASILYLSSFDENEIRDMKILMENIFDELKKTLSLEIEKSEWAVDWGREVLLKKLKDTRMSIPDFSFINKNYKYELEITENYFKNSMALMKKYRSVIYSVLRKNPNDPEQIWNFFATPYQTEPRTIYGLNLIVVPFGAIDWTILSRNLKKLDYVSLATIGNRIAREIAHNYDANGIRYWNGSRDSEFALMNDNDLTKTNFEDYLNCQRYAIYQEPVEMTLPVTGQRLSFMIPSLTLNDRLSDSVGMRLAHDTLARLGTDVIEERLPWLDLDDSQLFYLVYAQTHCTKVPLTSSYVSLYENSLLPSRIRVFVAASSNKNLGESWKCPEGSQLLPTFTCGIFPHLEYRGIMPDAA